MTFDNSGTIKRELVLKQRKSPGVVPGSNRSVAATKSKILLPVDTFFADWPVHIEISAPLGAGNSYFVMIDKYYNGAITKTSNYGWQIHLHPNTILQGDDVSIIIDLIEQNLME